MTEPDRLLISDLYHGLNGPLSAIIQTVYLIDLGYAGEISPAAKQRIADIDGDARLLSARLEKIIELFKIELATPDLAGNSLVDLQILLNKIVAICDEVRNEDTDDRGQ